MLSETIILLIFQMALAIVIIGLILRFFKQPHIITYILVGILLGPSFFGFVTDQNLLIDIGTIGVVLLMFFVGMEISIPRLVSNWKIAIIGPILQVIVATIIMLFFGKFLGWGFGKSLLMAFVITISSTAVIIKILKEWNELDTKIGQDVLGILIVQDIMVVPMLLILNLTSGKSVDIAKTIEGIIFGVLIISLIFFMIKKHKLQIPFSEKIKEDAELRFFLALIVCFGFSLLTFHLGLSSALGAFFAGILVSEQAHDYRMKKNLKPFYFFFVSIFFVSIGMLLDLSFIKSNYLTLFLLLALVIVLSTIINMLIMKSLGSSWRESLYAGALLSQLGEFRFVLAAMGLTESIITKEGYALIIALIALTLLVSPFWISFIKKTLKIKEAQLKLPNKMILDKIKRIMSKKKAKKIN